LLIREFPTAAHVTKAISTLFFNLPTVALLNAYIQRQVPQELLMMNFAAVMLLFLLTWSSVSQAEVRLAPVFGDHMVFQRHQVIPVWGWADPGEMVRLELNQQRTQTQADSQGRWRAVFAAEQAGGPYQLSVAASNTVVVNDVLIGEVWLAGSTPKCEIFISSR
jgi:sialate O-acetylesterase